jgi:uncharacterized protein with von Willebrand factor type A (vWA) domain
VSSQNGYLVQHDTADAWVWKRVRDAIPRLAVLETKAESVEPGAGDLLRDLFSLFFKARPQLWEAKTEPQARRRALLESVRESQDYRRLRLGTRLRELASAVAAADVFARLLEDWPKPQVPPASTPLGALASPDQVSARVREILRRAREKVSEVQAFVEAWGSDPGEIARLSLEESLALAERVERSPELQRIAALAGRVKRLALTCHSQRVRHGTDEIVSIETGAALARVLPQELVSLRHPVLRRDFLRRFSEGALLQYELSGRETLGRGPLVVCLDSSQSMAGDREAWAKAIALGLLAIARRERRDFALVHFGSNNECRVFRFERGVAQPQSVLEALAFSFRGGTDFERPLSEALALVETGGLSRADVIFVTDGACSISTEFLDRFRRARERLGFRVFSVLIDPTERLSAATLASFSDEVVRLRDLAQDDDVLSSMFTSTTDRA